MSGDVHVQFCERPGVRFPRATHLVIETEEKLQTGIEQRALPILEQLRHEQTDFLSDYNLTMNFFQFVSHQYMRTRASRERVGGELRHSFPGWDFGHLKHLVCHCAAENIGASLFVDRSKFQNCLSAERIKG